MSKSRKSLAAAALAASALAGSALGLVAVNTVAGAQTADSSTTAAPSQSATPPAAAAQGAPRGQHGTPPLDANGNPIAPPVDANGNPIAPPDGGAPHGPHQANGITEAPLTGDQLAKATAAANAKVSGGTIQRAETDADGDSFEVHMTDGSGKVVTVKMDANFNVTSVQDGMK